MITIIFSTFLTVFLAELGDKTQIATVALSGTSKNPMAVFIGSSLALILASFIGVALGGSIGQFVPLLFLQISACIGFLVIGLSLLLSNNDSAHHSVSNQK